MTSQVTNNAQGVFAFSYKSFLSQKNTFREFLEELNEGHYEYLCFEYNKGAEIFEKIIAFPNKRFLEIKKDAIKFFGYDGKVVISSKGKVTITYLQREDKEYCLAEEQVNKFQVNKEDMLKFQKAFELFSSRRFKALFHVKEIFTYFLQLTNAVTNEEIINYVELENGFDWEV